MNPNLKIDPRKISAINSNSKKYSISLASSNTTAHLINDYINRCKHDAHLLDTEPVKHHRIPKFILENFAGPHGDQKLSLYVVKYSLLNDGNVNIEKVKNFTPKGFSRVPNFYNIDEFVESDEQTRIFGANDKFRVEKLISVIETNAAKLIKMRQSKNFYSSKTYADPYYYTPDLEFKIPENNISKETTQTPEGQRIALAVFFAAQYLRSYFMYKIYLENKELVNNFDDPINGKFTGNSFPDFIEYMLPYTAYFFYGRAWRWVYSSHDSFTSEGTSILPIFIDNPHNDWPIQREYELAKEHSLLTSIGRNAKVYFLEIGTFNKQHDGVFSSTSLGVSTWSDQKLLTALSYDLSIINDKQDERNVQICMHPDSNIAHNFKTGQEANPKMVKQLEILEKAKSESKTNLKVLNFLGEIPRR